MDLREGSYKLATFILHLKLTATERVESEYISAFGQYKSIFRDRRERRFTVLLSKLFTKLFPRCKKSIGSQCGRCFAVQGFQYAFRIQLRIFFRDPLNEPCWKGIEYSKSFKV